MTFVLSALYGDRPKSEVYAMVQQVAKGFQAETGSLVCRVLLGLDPNVKPTPQATPHGGLLQKASLRRIMRPGRRPFRRLFKKYHLKGLHFAMRCAILFEQKRSSAFAYALVAQLDRVSGYEPEGRGVRIPSSVPKSRRTLLRFTAFYYVLGCRDSNTSVQILSEAKKFGRKVQWTFRY